MEWIKEQIKAVNLCGWVGMLLIHGSTMPLTIRAIFFDSVSLPPLDMVVMLWAGLALFNIRAIIQRDAVYFASNTIGFILQSIVLYLHLANT